MQIAKAFGREGRCPKDSYVLLVKVSSLSLVNPYFVVLREMKLTLHYSLQILKPNIRRLKNMVPIPQLKVISESYSRGKSVVFKSKS